MAGMMRQPSDSHGWGDGRGWGGESAPKSAGRRTWAATAWLVAGTIAVAVTGYSLSLKVAAERRDIERLARQNASLETDLKALEAELRVRMRMPQLQRWNDGVLGMVPISASQYLANPVQLAAYGDAIPGTIPGAGPVQAAPRAQLAVRDLAPEAPMASAAPRALLVSAEAAPRTAAMRAVPVSAPAMRSAPASAAGGIERPAAAGLERPATVSARSAAEAPADLLREVELNFGAGGGTNQ